MKDLRNIPAARAIIEQMGRYQSILKTRETPWTSLEIKLHTANITDHAAASNPMLCAANIGQEEMKEVNRAYYALIESRLKALNKQLAAL